MALDEAHVGCVCTDTVPIVKSADETVIVLLKKVLYLVNVLVLEIALLHREE